MAKKRQALLIVAMSLTLVVLLEAVVDLMALASPRIATILASPSEPAGIPDPLVGSRPNPLFIGHDARGFRNAYIPSRAEIVVFGDSQTYGSGVAAEAAWPRVLQSMTDRSVYNIAFGGFGPVHTLLLWDDGLKLHPHTIIEAVYTGNDLYDSFDMVYNRGQFEVFRTANPDIQRQVRAAQDAEPLHERVNRLSELCRSRLVAQESIATPEPASFLRDVLRDHSGLYGLARRTRFVVQDLVTRKQPDPDLTWKSELALAAAHPESCQSLDDGTNRTVFTTEYRLTALDLDDVRISEGGRVILAALDEMQKRAAAMGIRFIVLEIPTKELVFFPDVGAPTLNYERLVQQEMRFRDRLHHHLGATGIESIDALPALRAALSAGPSPYQATSDGHPNEHGHRAIARLLATRLFGGDPMTAR